MNKGLKVFFIFGMVFFGLGIIGSSFLAINEERAWFWCLPVLFSLFFALLLFAYLKFEIAEIQDDKIVILDRNRNTIREYIKTDIEKYGVTIQPRNYRLLLWVKDRKVKIDSLGNEQFNSIWEYLILNKILRIPIRDHLIASIISCIFILLMFGGISYFWREQCINGINEVETSIPIKGIVKEIQIDSLSENKSVTIKLVADTIKEYRFSTFYHYLIHRNFTSQVNIEDSIFLKVPLIDEHNDVITPVEITDKNWIYLSSDEYKQNYKSELSSANWAWVGGPLLSLFAFFMQWLQWRKQDKLSKDEEEKYWKNKHNTM